MELIPVKSSTISKIGYDPDNNILLIAFNSGSIYEFQSIPEEIYQELMQSPSIGKFFSKNIRTRYVYKKIV